MSFYSFDDSYSSAYENSEAIDSARSNYTTIGESEESYTKVKVLGRGAFGEAVLYRKTATNDLVVWKEINLQRASDKERTGALNEVEILSLLDHINVVAYYNHFFDGASLFIEMEYANDGSLHHKIISRDGKLFPENEALLYFYQLVSAVSYIHNFGILHRDIKTLNIFMTKSKLIKLGDFGISKVLEETYGQAETCVGTPYYMSPELVKGDPYNQKSDVWACGCVLFEIFALKKVFEASNQLKLITSILEKDVGEISDVYSEEAQRIVRSTLEKDPEKRPTTEELSQLPIFDKSKLTLVNTPRVPPLLRRISSQRSVVSTPLTPTAPVSVSTLASSVFTWGGGKVVPQKLETFAEGQSGIQVSAGFSHFAVITIEKEVYTWANIQGGTEIVGQLGHGNTAMYRSPKKVEFFNGIPIKQVACGEDFTVFLSDSGNVYACGSDYSGCIGCDESLGDKVLTPHQIETFDGKFVKRIACGDSHVVAMTDQGEVYAWGCGEYGRLGLGHEDDCSTPQLVPLPKNYSSCIIDVACGRDNTFLLTTQGHLLAFGSNEDNKMALNQTVHLKGGGKNREIDFVYYVSKPTPVRALNSYRLVAVASGKSHSAALDEYGRLLTFGANKYGQLGVGDYKPRISPSLVRGSLTGKEVILCACGDGFTVVATKDSQIFSWGSAKNGRLGIQLAAGKSLCSTPKPIFGSLHKVASLSCRHWNTIILAEKLIDSKLIHTKELSMTEEGFGGQGRNYKAVIGEEQTSASFQFDDIPFDNESDAKPKRKLERQESTREDKLSDEDDSMPPWLVDELQNAEVIPMKGGENEDRPATKNDDDSDNEDSVPAWLADEMENAEFIPMDNENVFEQPTKGRSVSVRETFQSVRASSIEKCSQCLNRKPDVLEMRIKELEFEKAQLTKRVSEQEVLIKKLESEKECYQKFTFQLKEVTQQLPDEEIGEI
ncbi:serine/threonine-protein kinase Nek9-like [Clytia hemisphaerica]|uniref:non-specific serine/threonine protein kinase n=1 Tax=Clytia hemisphaerica TaxID=252671 RepID=A0A7M6DQH1_9CNID